MTDDIIKKIFEVTATEGKVFIENRKAELKERVQIAQSREKNYGDLVTQVNNALGEILKRSRDVPPEQHGAYYSAEIRSLVGKLTNLVQSSHDEVVKVQGMLFAQDDALRAFEHMTLTHDTELQKARSIYDKAESGQIDAKRKPGERPDKLKDVRNYSPKQKQDETATE